MKQAVEQPTVWLSNRGVVTIPGVTLAHKKTALTTLLLIVLLSGCVSQTPEGHGTVAPGGGDGAQTHQPTAGYEDTVDISSATEVGIGTTLVADPSVLTVTVPGQTGDATFEMSEDQCSLRLVQVAASVVDATFTNDDIDNSIMVTVIFHGAESPIERPDLGWTVNKGEGTLGAHSSLFADEDGAQTLTISRGVGSLSQLFYSELSCAPGVDAVEVYSRSVAPRVWISAE